MHAALPGDRTIDEVLHHLYVLQEVSRGLADVDAGETISHDVVRERLRQKRLIGNAD